MINFFKKFLTVTLFAVGLSFGAPKVHAVEFSIGAKLGFDFSLNSSWFGDPFGESIAILALTANQYSSLNLDTWSPAFSFSIFSDFRFVEWFSLTPGVQFTFLRTASFNETYRNDTIGYTIDLTLRHTSIDFELLPKFHVGWWYIGLGPLLTINTKPSISGSITTFGAGFSDTENINNSDFEDNYRRVFVGYGAVLETGIYIPIAGGNHNITVGFRGTVDFKALIGDGGSITSSMSDGMVEITGSPKMYGATSFSLGLNIGYLYRFK